MTDWKISEEARALHRSAIVCDLTIPWGPGYENKERTLPRFTASGVTFVSLTVGNDFRTLEQTVKLVAAERARFLAAPDRFRLVETADDIVAAKRDGTLGVAFNFQGTNTFGGDVALVEFFYKLGVRHALLAYNQKNLVGDGCHERTDAGLSRFGIALIREMNRVGMLVDGSHSGYRTTMEAMDVSSAPVIFSHSNPRAVRDHERNIRDEQIRACAAKGGVIGINGVGTFLGEDDARTETFVRHIDYVAQLVGAAHVALGTDLVYYEETMYRMYREAPDRYPKGYTEPPWQFFQPEQLPEVTGALLQRGYREADVRGILGENFLRVARQVWR